MRQHTIIRFGVVFSVLLEAGAGVLLRVAPAIEKHHDLRRPTRGPPSDVIATVRGGDVLWRGLFAGCVED